MYPKNMLFTSELVPVHMITVPGLQALLRPKHDLPIVTGSGALGEMSVFPPQVEFIEFHLGPRVAGELHGASKLDWSVFLQKTPYQRNG